MRQCSFEKLARFEMAVFEFARGYTNSYRRPTSQFCLTNGHIYLAFFYLCSTLNITLIYLMCRVEDLPLGQLCRSSRRNKYF